MADNQSNCTSVSTARIILTVYLTSSGVATIFYLAAVYLIIKTRIYKQLIHRLALYLSIGGLFRAVANMFRVIPVDVGQPDSSTAALRGGNGWNGLCVFGAVFTQYTGFVQTFTVVWICVYIFLIAVFSKRLGEKRHETLGVVIIIFGPALFIWEPFVTNSYGFDDVGCGIKDATCPEDVNPALGYKLGLNVVPQLLMTLVGLGLLLISIIVLTAKARRTRNMHGLSQSAVLKIWPLAIYPFLYSLIYVGRMVGLAVNEDTNVSDVGTLSLLQAASAVVPISLVVHYEVRGILCGTKKGNGETERLTSSLTTTLNTHKEVVQVL